MNKTHRVTATLTTDKVLELDEWLNGLTLTQKLISILETEKEIKRRASIPSEPTIFDKN